MNDSSGRAITWGIRAKSQARIERLRDRLDSALKADGMNVCGCRFHGQVGDRESHDAVTVSGNWRIFFRFDGEDASDIDLDDYEPTRSTTAPDVPRRGAARGVPSTLRMTQTEFAARLGVSRLSVSERLHGKRGMSPEMALRVAERLNTSPESWPRMQQAVDLQDTQHSPERLSGIKPLSREVLAA